MIVGIGAHVIKVGLSPILVNLMEQGIVTAVAMNGAGIIHDFELALMGHTSEEVDAEIDEAIGRIAEQNRPFLPKPEGADAASGDKVTVSFSGTIDGSPFEGGTGEAGQTMLANGLFGYEKYRRYSYI